MKKAIGLSLAAVMAMSLTACGGGKSDAPAAGTPVSYTHLTLPTT